MTTDDELRARLERLAAQVPTAARGPRQIQGSGRDPAPHVGGRRLLPAVASVASAFVLVAVAVFVIGLPKLAGSGSSASDSGAGNPQPIRFRTGQDANAYVRLTVEVVDSVYAPGQPIEVHTWLEALATGALNDASGGEPTRESPRPSEVAFFGSSQPVGFGVAEVGGTRAVNPVSTADCAATYLRVNEPTAVPFQKSGAVSSEFAKEYLNITDGFPDPALRLPAGTWRIYAQTTLEPGTCTADGTRLVASVTVTVRSGDGPSPATTSVDPLPSASATWSSTDSPPATVDATAVIGPVAPTRHLAGTISVTAPVAITADERAPQRNCPIYACFQSAA